MFKVKACTKKEKVPNFELLKYSNEFEFSINYIGQFNVDRFISNNKNYHDCYIRHIQVCNRKFDDKKIAIINRADYTIDGSTLISSSLKLKHGRSLFDNKEISYTSSIEIPTTPLASYSKCRKTYDYYFKYMNCYYRLSLRIKNNFVKINIELETNKCELYSIQLVESVLKFSRVQKMIIGYVKESIKLDKPMSDVLMPLSGLSLVKKPNEEMQSVNVNICEKIHKLFNKTI